ncbi:MAG: response regulator [Gemmatimonadaceae bacterium]
MTESASAASASDQLTHILVVDDEPHIGRIIQTRLEQGPFTVTVAETGAQALLALERDPRIKLVVLDLMLPGMSGLDVLSAMRADERWKNLLCVVLTAAGHDVQTRQTETLGVSEFMTKPFSPRRLFARVMALTGISPDGISPDGISPDRFVPDGLGLDGVPPSPLQTSSSDPE